MHALLLTVVLLPLSISAPKAQTLAPPSPAASAPSPTLTPGAKAPPFAATAWLTALPTTSFELGKVSVLLFWSIDDPDAGRVLAHVASLCGGRQNVAAVALHDIAPPTTVNSVRSWVDSRRAWMHLSVGVDELRASWNAWMTPSGLTTTPTVFIINREGRLAFAGPAAWIDGPLAQVFSGDSEYADADGLVARLEARRAELVPLASSNPAAFIAAWDELNADYPLAVADLAGMRLRALHATGRADEAGAWVHTLINGLMMRRDAAIMLDLAEAQVQGLSARPATHSHSSADLTLVRHLSSLADQLAGNANPRAKAALAQAWYLAGGYPHAIREIGEAIRLSNDPEESARYQALLGKYESAQRQTEEPRARRSRLR